MLQGGHGPVACWRPSRHVRFHGRPCDGRERNSCRWLMPLRPSPLAGRPRLLVPGIRTLPPGTERFVVAGGGSVTVPVFAGDRLTVVDREGGQVCEIVAITGDGAEQPGILGATDSGPAEGLRTLLAEGGPDADALVASLKARGLPARFEHGHRCFGPENAGRRGRRCSTPSATASSSLRRPAATWGVAEHNTLDGAGSLRRPRRCQARRRGLPARAAGRAAPRVPRSPPARPMPSRSRRASSSRSSISRGASAPTSRPSPCANSTRASSATSTRPRPAP